MKKNINIKNYLKQKLKDTKGAVSILMVIFLLMLCTAFSLLIDMSSMMFGMKDIQGKIDMAGVNALYNSIDERYLRDETLGIVNSGAISTNGNISLNGQTYVNTIKTNYTTELNNLKYPGSNPQVKRTDVRFEYSDYGVGYNSSTSNAAKRKPQVILESVVSYDVPTSTVSDEFTRNVTKSIKSFYDNSTFSVTISDSGKDGKSTVMLHSITRIILN